MSNSSIGPIDRTLSGALTQGQSEAGSNANERVLHVPQSFKTGISPSDWLMSYPGYLLERGVLLLCRNVVGVFCSPSRLGCCDLWQWSLLHFLDLQN